MASIKRYLFARPPFRFVASHLAQDDDFIEDARCILALDQDKYARLSAQLNAATVFLNTDVLESITSKVLGDVGEPKKVASIIYKLSEILHASEMRPGKAMDALASAIQESASKLEPEERRGVSDRIRALAAEPAGLARQHKAQDLAGEIGAELDGFTIVCDIRPVFDKPRERIEGAMPIVVLHLEYSRADGEAEVLEVRITERQIEAFERKFTELRKKLASIGELLTSHQLPMPTIDSSDSSEE
jgi:hypothetical protein